MKDSLEWLLDPEDGLVAAPPVSTELETLHGNLLNQLGNLQHLLNSNHKVSEELRALRLAYREDSALGLNIAEALATNSVSWSDRPYIAVCEHKNGEVSFECPTETYCHAIVGVQYVHRLDALERLHLRTLWPCVMPKLYHPLLRSGY